MAGVGCYDEVTGRPQSFSHTRISYLTCVRLFVCIAEVNIGGSAFEVSQWLLEQIWFFISMLFAGVNISRLFPHKSMRITEGEKNRIREELINKI